MSQCKTEAELRKWYKENEQGLGMLGQARVDILKADWQRRLNDLKAPTKKGKVND